MKKLVLSIFIIGSFGLYVLWQSRGNSPSSIAPQAIALTESSHSRVTSVSLPTPVPATNAPIFTPAPVVPKKTGLYNDGTYTGSVADAYYGNVQVEVIITNGKISDVQFLDYPQDRNTSRRINSAAMPYLTQEAIQAQSANVDGVSGASDTSAAFNQSLASALAQARA